MPKNKLLILVLQLWVLLSACTTAPVANVSIQAASYLNPDINGQASPIVITIYQLKSPFIFKSANYSDLINNASGLLGADLVDKEILELRPNQRQTIQLNIQQTTKFIGVIAAYRNLNAATWSQIVSINNKGKTRINIEVDSQGLTVTST